MRRTICQKMFIATVAALTMLTTAAASADAGPGDRPARPGSLSCGSTTYLKADGSPWRCTFADGFSGAFLDTRKWSPQQTAVSGLHAGRECLVDSTRNVSVANGVLRLTARKEASPFVCKSPFGSYSTQYTSGGVTTFGKFKQTFGRFEFRAKFPAAKVAGLHSALWLYPEQQKYGMWPASGEIDVAEAYSLYPDRSIPYVHYRQADPTDTSVTNWFCKLDPSQFQTYVAEWTPTKIKVTNAGTTCLEHVIKPAEPFAAPAPFDQPFNVLLTQALGIGSNAFNPATTPLPATMQVDWVRVWS